MGKQVKTNAMRLLDANKVSYEAFHYYGNEENTDGTLVARMNQRDVKLVHKTLVAKSAKNELYVFIIPITRELDLKKAALATGEKKIEMLPHKDLQKYTGYLKGGCSPLGMKKLFPTFLEQSSSEQNKVIVSGGKKGHIIELDIADLLRVVNGQPAHLVKEA
ncbi:Cys-tRNA(Pro) deacylase [Carboxylicivirga taeanensis]|uniref:Cys-tRNA(Pro) deacylase n=1 Tax=Carboxylicivirga taeanensis TaxID=1416875 RepID=UPI003F6DB646